MIKEGKHYIEDNSIICQFSSYNVLCVHRLVYLTDGVATNAVLLLLHVMKYIFTEIKFPYTHTHIYVCVRVFYNLQQ